MPRQHGVPLTAEQCAAFLAYCRRDPPDATPHQRDFGKLIGRRRLSHAGVIFFRLRTQDPQAKLDRLAEVLTAYRAQLDQFLVVTERRVRVRQWLPSDQGEHPPPP